MKEHAARRVRIMALVLCLAVTGLVMTGRLASLQLVQGAELARRAHAQRAQALPIGMARGLILDRNGVPLTDPHTRLKIGAFPALVCDLLAVSRDLADVTGQNAGVLLDRLRGAAGPVELVTGVSEGVARKVAALNLPGVVVVPEVARYGPGSLARHVVGYTTPRGDRGVAGLEAEYDDLLRVSRPEALVALVDASRRAIPGLGLSRRPGEDRPGQDLALTIDSRVQRVVEDVLDRAGVIRGTVVVLDAWTGDILAMASRPQYRQDRVADYLGDDRNGPLLNRAVRAFTPGSIFKVVVALAALESGLVDMDESFECSGTIDVGGGGVVTCPGGGHGRLTFREALAQSCNVTFVTVGRRVGGQALLVFARSLGLARVSGAGLDGEMAGTIPDPAGLSAGDLANLSIGQGELAVTPLQMAQIMAAVARGGEFQAARVVAGEPRPRPRRAFSTWTAWRLQSALAEVTRAGTGKLAAVHPYGTAGKTGTAQSGEDVHAWFAGYGPLFQPRFVTVVLVEGGRAGGTVAAPLFREIMAGIMGPDGP